MYTMAMLVYWRVYVYIWKMGQWDDDPDWLELSAR
jgi:hypothetical protein